MERLTKLICALTEQKGIVRELERELCQHLQTLTLSSTRRKDGVIGIVSKSADMNQPKLVMCFSFSRDDGEYYIDLNATPEPNMDILFID